MAIAEKIFASKINTEKIKPVDQELTALLEMVFNGRHFS
ncbi:MAG: hypothetical protein Ct9H90mP19_2790 [Gammaproteobacteria bacterium]|nr:MAG: hypothetical protein Ct9H90mP19_2790 [Gammaproteobacteria bacterium]